MVEPLRSRTMTLEQLQCETLQMIKKVRKQLYKSPWQEGLSDEEFIDKVLSPFAEKIKQDMEIQDG